MRRAVAALTGLLLILLFVLLYRAVGVPTRQLNVPPAHSPAVDVARATGHLAEAIRFPTVSHDSGEGPDAAAFRGLAAYLDESYPLVRANLRRETVSEYSLLYTWPGRDNMLAPVLLAAHLDVVPADPATEKSWKHPPFAGAVADGYLWGRGSLDDKTAVIEILEAVETLLESGARPARTVYLAFGHDEEATGRGGAGRIAALLRSRGIHLEYALDEGGFVTTGIVPGIRAPVAVVAVAEKGFLNVELKVAATGGHSSAPAHPTAVGILADAIHNLERQPFPAAIRPPQDAFFEYAAPEMDLPSRLGLMNLWLLRPLVLRALQASPLTDATLRTTIAPTMLEGSPKSNVLPNVARAVINLRLMPGDTVDFVLDHIRRAIDNPAVQIRAVEGSEATTVSDIGAPAGVAIQRAIREVFPEAVVTPSLMIGASDVRYYAPLANNAYRFLPVRVGPDVSRRTHGVDERVALADLEQGVRFYARLLHETAMN